MAALNLNRFRRRRGKPRKLLSVRPLPTMLTLGNLLCGFAAIVLSMRCYATNALTNTPGAWSAPEYLYWAGILIFVGMLFDVLDGRVARLTNSMSQFGLEMDSLADVVSFGVAPAILLKSTIDYLSHSHWMGGYPILDRYVWLLMGVYVSCAALRLARYNVEASTGHLDHFYGIPSPAAAGCIASLVVMVTCSAVVEPGQSPYLNPLKMPPVVIKTVLLLFPFLMMMLGIMMVTRVRYLHIGDKLLGKRKSFMHILILILGLVLIIMQHEVILVLAFNGYMISGLLNEIRQQLSGNPIEEKASDEDEREDSEASDDSFDRNAVNNL